MFDSSMLERVMANAPNFYTEVRNPKWANPGRTQINCEVNFKHVNFEEWTPFTADPDDYMPYSKEIFDRAVAGEFGEVQEPDLIEVIENDIIIESRPLPRMNGEIGGVIL